MMEAHERQAALERARQGNQQAMKDLVESFLPYLEKVTECLQGEAPGSCPDLAKRILEKARQSFQNFPGQTVGEFVDWLHRGMLELSGTSAGTGALQKHLTMGKALSQLPVDVQQVLLGRHADLLSFAELARRLGWSEAATRVCYVRGLRLLAELDAKDLGDKDPDFHLSTLLEEALLEVRAQRELDITSWITRYPEGGAAWRKMLETMWALETFFEGWKGSGAPPTESGPAVKDQAARPLPTQLGRYRIIEAIGGGGMGRVFKAHDIELDRVVAVKIPRLDVPEFEISTWRKRFLREGRVAGRIRHPHVCPIYDVGEQDGVPFVVMAYVDGPSLAHCLRGENPYDDPVRAVRLVQQVAEALEAVHRQGLVHRDLKPGNILIDRDAQAVLTDFGLARPDLDAEHLTEEGLLLGTPAFMAPEQAVGQKEAIGPWTDLYSLGVVLYRLLTGRLPYVGNTVAVLWKIGNEKPPLPSQLRPGLDPHLEGIVLKAMAACPAERFSSAGEFARVLSGWLAYKEGAVPLPPFLDAPTKSYKNPGPSPLPLSPPAGRGAQGKKPPSGDTDELSEGKPAASRRGLPKRRRALLAIPFLLILLAGACFLAWKQFQKYPDQGKPISKNSGKQEESKAGKEEIQAERLTLPESGRLSESALVRQPAKIAGLLGWTLETRWPRGPVWALAYSPQGHWLALAGQDGMVRLWDTKKRVVDHILVGHDGPVRRLAWSPRGKILASAGEDGTVRIWEAASGRLLRTFRGHEGAVLALAWSPDGLSLASGGRDRKVRLWKTTEKSQTTSLDHEGDVNALAWSPEGTWLASSAAGERRLRLWKMPSGQEAASFAGHDFPLIHDLAWTADGQTLISAGQDSTVRFWGLASRKQKDFIKLPVPVLALAVSPKETLLATGSVGGTQLWDFAGKPLGTLGQPFRPIHALAWSPSGQEAAVVGEEGKIRLWKKDNQPAGEIGNHPGGRSALACSQDGLTLAVAGFSDKALRLWEISTGKLQPSKEEAKWDSALAWSPDNTLLANGGMDGRVRLWDIARGRWQVALPAPAHGAEVCGLAWPIGTKVFSAGADGSLSLLDPVANKVQPLPKENGVLCATCSPDGHFLAAGTNTGLSVWEAADRAPLRFPGSQVLALAWSPDGKLLAEGSFAGEVRLRAAKTWKVLAAFPAHSQGVLAVAWSVDSDSLATGGRDCLVRFWDSNGKARGEIKGFKSLVHSLSWLGKNKILAFANADGIVSLCRPDRPQPHALLIPLANRQGLVLDAEGNFLPSGDADLVFVGLTEKGQRIFTPEELSRQFGWKNNPERVQLGSK